MGSSKSVELNSVTTKSVVLQLFGNFENIRVCQLPLYTKAAVFEPEKDDVVVEVSYCGVNFADIYMRKGLIPTLKTPYILGLECVGCVKNVGSAVKLTKIGQRVLCYRGSGGLYREMVVVPEKCCFVIPDTISDEQAVCLPANYLTAFFSLFRLANLRSGNKILIHSCAGGVGLAASQLARTVDGVTILGTASGDNKCQYALENGVDYVTDSRENYYEHLMTSDMIRDGGRFDIIIDSLGGFNLQLSLSLLRPLGKVIAIGANSAIEGDEKLSTWELLKLWWNTKYVNVTNLIMNNTSIAGLNLDRLLQDDPQTVHSAMSYIFQLFQEKKIHPKIDSVWPIDQAVDAMKVLSSRKNIGKVILKI